MKRVNISTDRMMEEVQRAGSVQAAARALGIPRSTLWGRLHRDALKQSPEIRTIPVPEFAFTPEGAAFGDSHIGEDGVDTVDRSKPGVVQRFILTSAQNNARVHAGFWGNLNAFATHMDAEILVSFSVYDKTGYRGIVPKGETKIARQDIWWDNAFEGHAVNKRVKLARRLAFCGELDVIATAADPLSGLDSYCGRSSVIVPHNKFRFKCVESRKHQMPKELYTTGSATIKRFIQRKTGQVAQFHHVIGALLVEVDENGYFWVHHLNAEPDGSFYFLDAYVCHGTVTEGTPIAGIILGDIHHEKLDESIAEITLGKIIPELRPNKVIIHDLIDFSSRNHHNIKDPLFRVKVKDTRIQDELGAAGAFLKRLAHAASCGLGPHSTRIVVAESNHDEALLKWLKETDWREDATNAEFYLRMALRAVQKVDDPEFNLLHDALGMTPFAEFLKVDDSFEIAGIECGMHGHVGPSGARGSPKGFSRLGFKSFTAHTHCLTGDHRVHVIGRGWVPIPDVQEGDSVMAWDPRTGANKVAPVEATIRGEYSGILTQIGRQFRQVVTDKHRIALRDGRMVPVGEAVLTACPGDVPISAAPAVLDELGVDVNDQYLRQLVAFCADGCYDMARKTMRFHFQKPRKILRCNELFAGHLTAGSGGVDPHNTTRIAITRASSLWEKFEVEFAAGKRLPEWLWNLDDQQLRIVMDELPLWDGTADTGSRGFQWSSSKPEEADLVCRLANRLGWRTTMKKRPNGGWFVTWCPPLNGVPVRHNDKKRLDQWGVHTTEVVGEPVFCLTTETGNFWVLNGTTGQVSLTGNSPSIVNGCYTVGVMGKLDMGYNRGPSKWMHTHGIIYRNGKRAFITVKNGKWRA